ncbi:MAG: MFS transporter [Candidatus Dormibacteria bacterium]
MTATTTRPAADTIEQVEANEHRLLKEGRAAMGVSGEAETAPFWRTLRENRLSIYPLVAIGLLAVVDRFQSTAFYILAPEISRALGMSKGLVGLLVAAAGLSLTLAALPMARLVQNRPRRGLVAITTGIAWSVMTLFTGLVTTPLAMFGIVVADGASSGSVASVQPPLLTDSYPTQLRVRMLGSYYNFVIAGSILAPLLVYLLTGPADLTWRGVFLVMGVISIVVSLCALRLRDPGFGRWDSAKLRQAVRHDVGGAAAPNESATSLGFFEIVRRLMMIPTLRRVLFMTAVLGVMTVPLNTFFVFFLEERWHLGPSQRALFFTFLPIFGMVMIALQGRWGERLFRSDPPRLFRLCATMMLVGILCLGVSIVVPVFWAMFVLFGLTVGLFAALNPLLGAAYFSIIRAEVRPHAAALIGIFQYGVGGIAGALLLGSFSRHYGTIGALVSTVPFGLLAALIIGSAAKVVNQDLDRTVGDLVEEEELRAMSARGVKLPMLACRHIDFAYDKLQVLFDVDFTVDDGEMVALLGTNGAGKSSLLRVVSGLGLPSRGSVRFRGADITYIDPERRVGLGITQVPGGRAVFGPLTVVENMSVYGYSLGRSKRETDRGIEASFAAFPRLAERRNQPASNLSGGEQQMLGLAKALILQPRLLLIDELSLGLAPKVVGELLETVRRINQAGTAVVLVEQSVNVALSVVNHAYFMEKGEIRFDGKAAELLARGDLLRSVFLEGATRGLDAASRNGKPRSKARVKVG